MEIEPAPEQHGPSRAASARTAMEKDDDGLIFAVLLDARGGGRALGWAEVESWKPEQGFLWVHLNYARPRARAWLSEKSAIDALICESLIAEAPRPRSLAVRDGLLVMLRGINHNPGEVPEDMVALRLWLEPFRAVTLRQRRLRSVGDVRDTLDAGTGPCDPGELLVDLCDSLCVRIELALTELDEEIDALEDEVQKGEIRELRRRIGVMRRETIGLRRYLAPQRDAMAHLQSERVPWLDGVDRSRLHEVAEQMTRFIEDLDSSRDRTTVLSEELNSRVTESLNRTMYVLSIVATIFMPLTLLTGLLGINVGGIPGSDHPYAFWIVCSVIVSLAIALYFTFRMKRMI